MIKLKSSKPGINETTHECNWELMVDLDKKFVFPNIVETTLRPR